MQLALLVGVGGFLGAILRYFMSGWVQDLLGKPYWPYGTLAVNVLGCLVLGFLVGLVEVRNVFSPEVRSLLFIGVLGGFTTFSTFGVETSALLRDGALTSAAANILLQVVLGVGAAMMGYYLSQLT
ncbi:MAG: fluoride efflux transporter CrcB [Chloroflexi bacterium]|nr:fluoride efflux transporter CrcB [Chloroflexota bacterium]